MNLFGHKKSSAPPAAAKPKVSPEMLQAHISDLREQRETLEKRQAHLELQAHAIAQQAVERNKKGDKKGALILLKRKKLYSTDVERISNMIMNVDVQLHAVEGAVSNVGYAKTVGATAGILKAVGQEMDAEKVDDLVADLKESLADQDDVNSALAEELGPHVDESELESELEELTVGSIAGAAPAVDVYAPAAAAPAPVPVPGPAFDFPAIPTTLPTPVVAAAPDREAAELAAFQAMMTS